MMNDLYIFGKKEYFFFFITSSENLNHNLSKWLRGINIMSMVFCIQFR